MRLIFSKNRAAQLDLLLRSLLQNAEHEMTKVIWDADVSSYSVAYELLPIDRADWMLELSFDLRLRRALLECPDPTVTFFCDDDVVFARVPQHDLLECYGTFSDQVLCFSLRLGKQNAQMEWPGDLWNWQMLPRTDFGFPGSIDGHTFRVDDVLWMIDDRPITNPTILETVLAERCELLAEKRPMMACYEQQSVVGIPVNRVSESSGVPFGKEYPADAAWLNKRFLKGLRISLDALDFSGVDGCHKEIKFEWEDRP